jgi:phosphopantothenoylcysteine decarboxylase/phosphopantothenate--cysteine ligase
VHVVDPAEGRLAGGDVGAGRLAEPVDIVAALEQVLSAASAEGDLQGLKVLVTAGGTREPIDPVRFLGNRSSGKQGHALAEEAAQRGAEVILVTTAALRSDPGIERIQVETAQQMHDAVMARASSCDVVVMAAAVADFTPVAVSERKLKKRDGVPVVELRQTPDILSALGDAKPTSQSLVGFAAETHEVREHALEKLRAKNADLLVANDVAKEGVGFEHDTNEVVILSADGGTRNVPLTDKRSVARAVLDAVVEIRSMGDG